MLELDNLMSATFLSLKAQDEIKDFFAQKYADALLPFSASNNSPGGVRVMCRPPVAALVGMTVASIALFVGFRMVTKEDSGIECDVLLNSL